MRVSTTALLCLLTVTACDAGGGFGEETDLETAFCDLLENGPEVDVTAADSGAGPELAAEDQALEIALVDDGSGMFWGRGTYTADESGSFAMGLSDDIPVVVLDSSGQPLDWENEVTGADCSDLAIRYTVALEEDTYTIEFGPTEIDEIGFVSEESDDDL